MSDTPRTDANADIEEHGPFAPAREMVHAEFARKLERELDEARAELKSIRAAIQTIYYDTEGYADGAPDASRHDKLCNEIAATLKPFIK